MRLHSDDDFDTFVRGAVAQYSADGQVPEDLRPRRVRALAEQVWAEAGGPGAPKARPE